MRFQHFIKVEYEISFQTQEVGGGGGCLTSSGPLLFLPPPLSYSPAMYLEKVVQVELTRKDLAEGWSVVRGGRHQLSVLG